MIGIDYALAVAPQLLGGAFAAPLGGSGWLGRLDSAAYETWVFGERAPKPVILFGGPLEPLTRTTPASLLACYVPFLVYCAVMGAGGWSSLPPFLTGLLAWGLVEYLFHRFIFHHRPTTNLEAFVHFCLHGIHHHCPMDAHRLLMPPFLGLSVALAALLGLGAVLPQQRAYAAVGGSALGYLVYDLSEWRAAAAKAATGGGLRRLRGAASLLPCPPAPSLPPPPAPPNPCRRPLRAAPLARGRRPQRLFALPGGAQAPPH